MIKWVAAVGVFFVAPLPLVLIARQIDKDAVEGSPFTTFLVANGVGLGLAVLTFRALK